MILGFHIDGKVDFDYHLSQICKKLVLSRVCKYMDRKKTDNTYEGFYNFQVLLLPYVVDVSQQKY